MKKNSPRILIIDDQIHNLDLLEIILTPLEVELDMFTSGKGALRSIREELYALALLDISMPDMDGFAVLAEIRQSEINKFIPVVFISALQLDDPVILKGIEEGAIDFIPKPVNHAVLIGKVRQYLQLYWKKLELDSLVQKLEKSSSMYKNSEYRFRNISYAASDAIVVLDENFRVSFWNRSSKLIFGYTKPEIHNEDFAELFFRGSERTKWLELLHEVYLSEDKAMKHIHEFVVHNKLGLEFYIEVSLSVFKLLDKKKYIILIIRDISKRKKMEKEVARAKQLQVANEVMKDFMDNVSHELRTPMNAILGISKMLVKHSGENLTQDQIDGLNIINQSGSRLLDLINDVLDFSKLESNRVKLQPEWFDIQKLLITVKSLVISLIQERDILYITRASRNLPTEIYADHKRLTQILLNLLGNSVKFTTKGKIVLSVHCDKDRLYFEVFDTGIGISEDDQKKIFDKFHQVDSSNSRQFGGTGLGLNITRKLIELMGGSISVKSKIDEFTLIKFSILIEPTDRAKEIALTKENTEATSYLPGNVDAGLILVIDDDDYFQLFFHEYFRAYAIPAYFAKEGKRGFEKIMELLPDIIFLNLEVAVLSGYSILKKLESYKSYYTPVIILRSGIEDFHFGKLDTKLLHITNDIDENDLNRIITKFSRFAPIDFSILELHATDIPTAISFFSGSLPNKFFYTNIDRALLIIQRRTIGLLVLKGHSQEELNIQLVDYLVKIHYKGKIVLYDEANLNLTEKYTMNSLTQLRVLRDTDDISTDRLLELFG